MKVTRFVVQHRYFSTSFSSSTTAAVSYPNKQLVPAMCKCKAAQEQIAMDEGAAEGNAKEQAMDKQGN